MRFIIPLILFLLSYLLFPVGALDLPITQMTLLDIGSLISAMVFGLIAISSLVFYEE